jgi:hypothetical protein
MLEGTADLFSGGRASAGLKASQRAGNALGIVDEAGSARVVEQGRDALGRFLPKSGGEVIPGSQAEQSVWDAVGRKPGWRVIEGRVAVRNQNGELRIYDGAAVSPRNRVIGLEVKSGNARRTGAQAQFDAGVSSANPATGVGDNSGLSVGRAIMIRRQ